MTRHRIDKRDREDERRFDIYRTRDHTTPGLDTSELDPDAVERLRQARIALGIEVDGQGTSGRIVRLGGGNGQPLPPQQTSGLAGVAGANPQPPATPVEDRPLRLVDER